MFVRYVSHEIRTPLNTACLGLQYLQDELTVKKSHGVESSSMMSGAKATALNEIVEQIHCSCDIAVNILNDLLTYENLEGGILESHMKSVCIWSLLRETIRPFKLQVIIYEILLLISYDIFITMKSSMEAYQNCPGNGHLSRHPFLGKVVDSSLDD